MKSQLHAFLLINQQVVFEWAVDADAGNRPCFEIFGPRMKYLAAAGAFARAEACRARAQMTSRSGERS
jgi:hypothetical protein